MQTRPTIYLTLCIALIACGKGVDAKATADTIEVPPAAPAPAASIDPCTFLTKEEIESALGLALDPGKQETAEPSCRFLSRTAGSVTVALPTPAVTAADFDGWRAMAGTAAEPVSDVGDAAYLWGPRLYVRKGTRTFTISITDGQLTPEIRAGLTKLGQLGASRLQ